MPKLVCQATFISIHNNLNIFNNILNLIITAKDCFLNEKNKRVVGNYKSDKCESEIG